MNEIRNNQSISHFADQLIRYYRIPFRWSKADALNAVLHKTDSSLYERQKRKRRSLRLIGGVSVAAVVVIGIVFWFFTATINLGAGLDEIASYRLPDGSRVVLQQNSEISYSKYRWNKNVQLAGGAYFEVQKGDGFLVNTDRGEVKVLGTRFSVKDKDGEFAVVCFEGKVSTTFDNRNWPLEQGTKFTGDSERAEKTQSDSENQFPEFATFCRSFSNRSLTETIGEIENFFNVEINVINGSERNFSGTIETGNLTNALEIISGSLQLNYRYVENTKIEIF